MRIAALSGALLLGACDTLPHARVINNTGAPIVLNFDEGGFDREARLVNGGARIVMAYGSPLNVTALNCRNVYVWPEMGLNFPFKIYEDGYPVSVQVQPDLKIYLLPYKAKAPAESDALARWQGHGFPLQPVKSDCKTAAPHGG